MLHGVYTTNVLMTQLSLLYCMAVLDFQTIFVFNESMLIYWSISIDKEVNYTKRQLFPNNEL